MFVLGSVSRVYFLGKRIMFIFPFTPGWLYFHSPPLNEDLEQHGDGKLGALVIPDVGCGVYGHLVQSFGVTCGRL